MAFLDLFKKSTAAKAASSPPARKNFWATVKSIFSTKRVADEAFFDRLEELLLTADVAYETVEKIANQLRGDKNLSSQAAVEPQLLASSLKKVISSLLEEVTGAGPSPFEQVRSPAACTQPVLMVGVNGVGKTTTIGKLAYRLSKKGERVLLAAGDTFRAAAYLQLKRWAERSAVELIGEEKHKDPAAVAYRALNHGLKEQADWVLIDTAGRLHTKSPLMDELTKIKRVLTKQLPGEVSVETLLVVDANMGQNALNQAALFHEKVGLTGLILTKMDSSAKGGFAISIVDQLGLPIRYLGVGEQLEDLKPFSMQQFLEMLF